MLTESQVAHFKTFGFLVLRQLFSPGELGIIRAEFDASFESAYAHEPFDGTRRYWVPMMGPRTPFFARLLEDVRFCTVAEQLYGEDVIGAVVDANRYVGSTDWHPDTAGQEQYGVKFPFYLQPVGAESGALRVIPGSHLEPLHSSLREDLKGLGLDIRDVPAHVCMTEPGDVVAFDVRLWHASYGGSKDRHMGVLVYYNNPKTAEQERATRETGKGNAKVPVSFNIPSERLYHPEWLANPDRNPKRQQWIDRMRELDFFEHIES